MTLIKTHKTAVRPALVDLLGGRVINADDDAHEDTHGVAPACAPACLFNKQFNLKNPIPPC
jgi:hypothetical protein